jgi:hypothetical protein
MSMAHVHEVEAVHGATGPATVLADIGGDVGAAVVYTPAILSGLELEIRAVGCEWDGTHTAVRERQLNGSVVWAGFFGTLAAGRYEVRVRSDVSRVIVLDVAGGIVTETQW